MINEIKFRGFEKYKNQIDEKLKTRKQLELTVDKLQKQLNFINSQKKHVGTQNSKIESEINLYKQLSNVCKFFKIII
jgi:hypothetical protein